MLELFFVLLSHSLFLAPEITLHQKSQVEQALAEVYGQSTSEQRDRRREQAREAATVHTQLASMPQHELVYGELGLNALVSLLDAVGVQQGDVFLDIGAGNGELVSAAALLYPDWLESSNGVEIVPETYEKSIEFDAILQSNQKKRSSQMAPRNFLLGNVYEPSEDLLRLLHRATLVVCFATTWSAAEKGRRLPKLSNALRVLPHGSRCVIIDGLLDEITDGYQYQGELKIHCPDTAPYSIAHSYIRDRIV